VGRLTSRVQRRALARLLELNKRAEIGYVNGLRRIARANAAEVAAFLQPHLGEIAKGAKADMKVALGNQLAHQFDLLNLKIQASIPHTVGPLASSQAVKVAASNAKGMKVMGVSYNDIGLGSQLGAFRTRNIDLISNAQNDYADQIRDVLSDPDSYDLTPDELAAKIQERGQVSESRAELIARDQTLKLNGQITEARQTSAGITSYVWSTSLDDRVRENHASKEGQTFQWSDPPNDTGHPGADYQCRCIGIPVI